MDWYTKFDELAEAYLPDLEIVQNEPMSRHTSFRIGGPARRMAYPKNSEQVIQLMELAQRVDTVPLVIGNGSNLLAPDEGIDRLVVDMSAAFHEIRVESETALSADCGVPLARLADAACKQGLTGLEFAHGIPGTLGGAICMNAGAYGGDMSQVLTSVTAFFPGEGVRTLPVEELQLGYRHSLFTEHPEAVILSAAVGLQPGNREEIRAAMRDLLARRKASQPLEFPSAGSTFKRPPDHYAGALIEQCGLKGLTVGAAQVSEKHAGFVINLGSATCADVLGVIHQVQERVAAETGVQLEPEVRIVR